ncbi:MAG: hypothetical protein ACLU8W_10785 [Clostridia bacterium]
MAREYTLLFNGITHMIEELDRLREELVSLQRQAEELYIGENNPV